MQRAFVRLTTQFLFGRPHGEGARRQHDHFRAVLAVLEHLTWRGYRRGGQGAVAEQKAEQGGQGQQCFFHVGSRWKTENR